ncbi:MAG: glycosyltransferase family 4 protein [Bacteroidales bacterium]|nr:glycosyltransferase family 4 protein [Bacteroidales bacterium]
MVIGFDAKRAFRNNTGLGNYSRMVICGLSQSHSEIRSFLYSPSVDGEYQKYFSSFANVSTRQPSGIDRFFPNIWRRWGVTFHLKGDDVDIFHGLSHELPHGIPRSIKKVVTMHDLIVWRYPQYYKAFDRRVHRIKQRHACRIADVVVAISEQTKQDLIKFLHVPESKIRVLYQSCDQQFWEPVKESDIEYVREQYSLPEKYIICVGTVEDRKNQKAVVKAFSELPEDVHLVIVGRSHKIYGVEVKAEVRSRKLSGRVHFITDADFSDFPALYAGAVASVYASKFEGFGIPILESMCCDTPVVTSNVSSMPEAGGDAALYASPEDPHEIAQQLQRLLDDPALRQECVEKGRVQRQKFSAENIVADFYNLYCSLAPESLRSDD